MDKNLSVGLNLIRITACFFVVLLHSSAMGLNKSNDSWPYLNIIDSMTRVSVPLFIMLSGALLFREKPDTFNKIIKRVLILLSCLIFWSVVYICRDRSVYFEIRNLPSYLSEIFHGPVKYHLWYLYVVVGIYAAIPILSSAYKNSSMKSVFTYSLIWFMICFYEVFKFAFHSTYNIPETFNLSFLSSIMGYLVVGKLVFDLCKNGNINFSKKLLLAIFILSGILTSYLVYILSKNIDSINQGPYSYISPIVAVGAISLFTLLLKLGEGLSRHDKTIKTLASGTLGVYCMHVLFIDYFYTTYVYWENIPMNCLYVFWSSICTFILSMLLSIFLKKTKIFSFVV